MLINYDTKKISRIIQDFYNATGINIVVYKEDFTYLENRNFWEKNRYCKAVQGTQKGNAACIKADTELLRQCSIKKKAVTHVCHAGLIDVAIPILYENLILGYIIFGQMKTDKDYAELEKYIGSLGLDTDEMNEFYSEIQLFESDKIQSISNLATMVVRHILLENIFHPYYDARTQSALNYINENLEKELSVQKICKNAGVSKSVLYRNFHNLFGCTVSEYINQKRVEKSVELLKKTNLSIEEISQKVGFSGVSYYGKIFKKMKGCTPLQYKKNI